MPRENEYFKYIVIPAKKLWSQVFLPFYLFTHDKPDVFFVPAHYAPRFSTVKTVVTIHDLSYLYYPGEFLKQDLYKLTNWTRYSIAKATKIIAVSQNTKRDLIKNYHAPENKISVIYNGFEKDVVKSKSLSIKKPYILYVGTLQPRKNISLLISAFDKFVKKHPKYSLIIAGKKGWLYDEIFTQVKRLNHSDKIQFTGYVNDQELIYLYQNAECFVLPSLYEGFGIPILEAMSYGCPVISSNASSLPEVGGDACLYFDPQSENQLLEQLEKLLSDDQLRDNLIRSGKQRVKLFSWQKSADQTLEVLEDVFNDKST